MSTFVQDLRYALRNLIKNPGFTIVAVLTLALGIGANVATYSVVYGVLLKPLPFSQPDQLVRVFDDQKPTNEKDIGMSVPELADLQERSGVFSEVSAVLSINSAIAGGDRSCVLKPWLRVPTTSHCSAQNRSSGASSRNKTQSLDFSNKW